MLKCREACERLQRTAANNKADDVGTPWCATFRSRWQKKTIFPTGDVSHASIGLVGFDERSLPSQTIQQIHIQDHDKNDRSDYISMFVSFQVQ